MITPCTSAKCSTTRLERDQLKQFVDNLQKHVIKCAKRNCNVDFYPEEWNPIKKQLNEITSKLS